ncbi:MAG: hypothetical protein IPK79_02870 [Vampirovibrionales bacterium]|nr:hypothetical protein [Vampirovibrionales bacterium]
MDKPSKTGHRWYDRIPALSSAVETILLLPESLQQIVCRAIVAMADKEFQASERIQNFKSLGPERILAYFKAKTRKRAYDQSPHAHKALTYMGLLSPDDRQYMAASILELMSLVKTYLGHCRAASEPPEEAHLERLSQTYVEGGKTAALQVLRVIEKELQKKVDQKSPTPSQLKESEAGMLLQQRVGRL